MLALPVIAEELYRNLDLVTIVHGLNNYVLYTSRSPIPYCEIFSPGLGAKRVGGIFGFRKHFLDCFTAQQESPFEIVETWGRIRSFGHRIRKKIAEGTHGPYFPVDSPQDIKLVDAALRTDSFWRSC